MTGVQTCALPIWVPARQILQRACRIVRAGVITNFYSQPRRSPASQLRSATSSPRRRRSFSSPCTKVSLSAIVTIDSTDPHSHQLHEIPLPLQLLLETIAEFSTSSSFVLLVLPALQPTSPLIALAGFLLEYPIVYWLGDSSSNCLGGRDDLMLVRALLLHDDQDPCATFLPS